MIAAVVLASGAPSRTGRREARPPAGAHLRAVCCAALASPADVVLTVLGEDAVEFAPDLAGLAVKIVFDEAWRSGIASSIHAAMRRLLRAHPLPEGVLFIHAGDAVPSSLHLSAMIDERRRGRRLVGTQACGRLVAPALYGPDFYPALLHLRGEASERVLLEVNREAAGSVPLEEAAPRAEPVFLPATALASPF